MSDAGCVVRLGLGTIVPTNMGRLISYHTYIS